MMCPSCRQDDVAFVETTCPDLDEPGELRIFPVCRNCDYGINDHTEGECDCLPVKPEDLTEEMIVRAMCDKEPTHYQDFDDFAHDCHSVSLALIRSGLLGEGGPNLRIARGACKGVGGQHSWVVLGHPYDENATIVDLTLWSYDSTQPRIWVGTQRSRLHRAKGQDHIWVTDKPEHRGGETLALNKKGLSPVARRFIQDLGPLDHAGWGALWSRCGMLGWPAQEILEACLDQHPTMSALVPIDIVGMVTDRNPENLYW